jgi:oligopeptide/dipeptide ABC transporter ATP-binding protein
MNSKTTKQGDICLSIQNLSVILAEDGTSILDDVSIDLHAGEVFALVGESGSGKSVTSMAAMRLLPDALKITSGKVDIGDQDLFALPESRMLEIRGRRVAMIFQNAMTALNPVQTVGNQVAETLRLHTQLRGQALRQRVEQAFAEVGIPNPSQRFDFYPHQLSGGQQQRVMIAMALACEPEVLIADEPTTALDVTIQAQILELMKFLQDELGMAILMITHNLGVIAEICTRVAVMYMGKIVETAEVSTIFKRPLHPYTVGLMRSIPHLGQQVKNRLTPIPGSVPDPYSIPAGCAFFPRCPAIKSPACKEEVPLIEIEPNHFVRCTLYQD